ncbi:MAG: prephenate dehydrogenase/arogenate dehydrogenase family protein, partial [Chloroflexota bacterium]|nr:prephenate dehydrogenase/arogenate dehydrogenase family protein [Chloroflexota bacterium]
VLCLSPLPSAHADAVAYVAGLAEVLAMEAFFVDAREHDAFFTGIGRLPSVLAAAYLHLVTRESSWRELGRIAGGEFKQLATMVDIDPQREQQALAGSRDHLVRWLDGLMGELGALRDALQDGREPQDFYGTAAEALRKWQQNRQLPPEAADLPPPPPVPKRRFLI